MRLEVVTPPTQEPLSLSEARDHLRVTSNTEDVLIEGWIQSAREEAERMSGRVMVTQTWRAYLDAFPDCSEIVLPKPPLASVSSVKYVDENGTLQTWNSSNYVVDTSGVLGRIYLAYEAYWPLTRREPNAVRVEFVAGSAASLVPAGFKSWMLLNVGERFRLREGSTTGTIATKIPNVDGLVMGERVGL